MFHVAVIASAYETLSSSDSLFIVITGWIKVIVVNFIHVNRFVVVDHVGINVIVIGRTAKAGTRRP